MVTPEDVRRQLEEAIKRLPNSILGSVKNVDKEQRTCTIEDDAVEIPFVRLQPITSESSGIITYPKIGAQALVLRIEETDMYYLVATSEAEQYDIAIGNSKVSVTADGIVLNDGTLGLVKIDQLMTWMSSVYSDLQTLITLLSTSSVAGNGAPLGIAFVPSTPKPEQANFEDTTVKH